MLGLDKREWEAMHITFVVAFLLSSLAHVCYNWRPLIAYLRPKPSHHQRPSSGRLVPAIELAAALVLTVILGFGTLAQQQPFSSVSQLRAAIKNGNFVTVTRPPVAEADRLTVAELSRWLALPEAQMLKNARLRGIVIRDTSATISTIARDHQVSPERVYEAIQGLVRP
jgi:hypothetical protein